jgi:histidinol-phosphatase (PHP family)
MHTRFSDGAGEPKDYAKRAVELGLTEIGISDHCPLPRPNDGWRMELSQLDEYVRLVQQAQRDFPSVKIRLALEMDFFPDIADFTRKLSAQYPWDYFLGSVHYIGEFNVDSRAEAWKGRDVDAVWQDYFRLWKQAALSGLYDTLAHPDLPKKFGFYPKRDMTAIYEDALQEVKKANIAIELSTAGLRKPCKEFYPSRDFLQIAQRLGVPISLGSDAHAPHDLGAGFAEAIEFARSVGYSQMCRFEKRRRELVQLG